MKSFARLVEELSRDLPDVDPRVLADWIWLSDHLKVEASPADAPAPEPLPGTPDRPDPLDDENVTDPPPDPDPSQPPPPETDPLAPEEVEVRLPTTRDPTNWASFRSDLRPLSLRERDIRATLDEQTTSERIASTELWQPAWHPTRRRKLHVALIVDTGLTMAPWSERVRGLIKTLATMGAFASLTVCRMDTDAEQPRLLRGTRDDVDAAMSPGQLVAGSGETLLLVVTDTVGKAWHTGGVTELLRPMTRRHLVSLLHVLPHREWDRTAMGSWRRIQGRVRQGRGAAITDRWNERLPRPSDIAWSGRRVQLPILAVPLGSRRKRRWVRFLRGRDDLPAFSVPLRRIRRRGIERRVDPAAFLASASPPTRRLATLLLASSTLTLPLLRILQRYAGLGDAPEPLHELFCSGLLEFASERKTDPNDNQYRLVAGASQALYRHANRADVLSAAIAVLDETGHGTLRRWLLDSSPDGDAPEDLPDGLRDLITEVRATYAPPESSTDSDTSAEQRGWHELVVRPDADSRELVLQFRASPGFTESLRMDPGSVEDGAFRKWLEGVTSDPAVPIAIDDETTPLDWEELLRGRRVVRWAGSRSPVLWSTGVVVWPPIHEEPPPPEPLLVAPQKGIAEFERTFGSARAIVELDPTEPETPVTLLGILGKAHGTRLVDVVEMAGLRCRLHAHPLAVVRQTHLHPALADAHWSVDAPELERTPTPENAARFETRFARATRAPALRKVEWSPSPDRGVDDVEAIGALVWMVANERRDLAWWLTDAHRVASSWVAVEAAWLLACRQLLAPPTPEDSRPQTDVLRHEPSDALAPLWASVVRALYDPAALQGVAEDPDALVRVVSALAEGESTAVSALEAVARYPRSEMLHPMGSAATRAFSARARRALLEAERALRPVLGAPGSHAELDAIVETALERIDDAEIIDIGGTRVQVAATSPTWGLEVYCSSDASGNPGRLNRWVFRELGIDLTVLRDRVDDLRKQGWVRLSASGYDVRCVVTVGTGAPVAKALLGNFGAAWRSAPRRHRVWIPLMGTGAGGLSVEEAARAIREVLSQAPAVDSEVTVSCRPGERDAVVAELRGGGPRQSTVELSPERWEEIAKRLVALGYSAAGDSDAPVVDPRVPRPVHDGRERQNAWNRFCAEAVPGIDPGSEAAWERLLDLTELDRPLRFQDHRDPMIHRALRHRAEQMGSVVFEAEPNFADLWGRLRDIGVAPELGIEAGATTDAWVARQLSDLKTLLSRIDEHVQELPMGERTRVEKVHGSFLEGLVPVAQQLGLPQFHSAPALEGIARDYARPTILVRRGRIDPKLLDSELTRRFRSAVPRLQRALPAVGRIEADHGPKGALGTAWLVTPDLVLTAKHVISELAKGGHRVSLDFRYESDSRRWLGVPVIDTVYVDPTPALDLAVLRVDWDGATQEPPRPLALHDGPLEPDRWVALIGHHEPDNPVERRLFGADTGLKRVALGTITRFDRETLVHDAVATRGTSGSPILDLETGRVVGMHTHSSPDGGTAVTANVLRYLLREHLDLEV